MKIVPFGAIPVLMLLTLPAAQAQPGASTAFSLQQTTTVPGGTLKSGSYNVTVLDSLSDRAVVQVSGGDLKEPRLLLVVPGNLSGAPGQPVFWQAKDDGHTPLRGFVFPNGRGVELVYPKADAVAIAKKNHSSVVAVDTKSENRPELSKLSSNDMQMVSLWLLTPTRVGQGEEGMAAQHYVPTGAAAQGPLVAQNRPAAPPAPSAPPATMASAAAPRPHRAVPPPPPPPAQEAMAPPPAPRPHRAAPPASTMVASSGAPPAGVKRLPKTASELPAVLLGSVLSLFAAATLRVRRMRGSAV